MNCLSYHCPVCHTIMRPDTASLEEFSCSPCEVMVDVLDESLAMVSTAPDHLDVYFVATRDLLAPATTVARS